MPADFADFAQASLPELRRFALLLAGSQADGDDLVQEALLRTALRWPYVRNRDRPEAYVRKAIVRLHINRFRRVWRRETLSADFPEAAAPAVDIETRDLIWRALRLLPARQRAVLVLRYYEDMSEATIAETLNCSIGTVKSQASRGLSKLHKLLVSSDAAHTRGSAS